METIDTLVVGAGVIGLACADALACAGHEVVVAESETLYGSGISSRNSEVIHSGIYYEPGSLKARLCVRGRPLLYEFCERHGVPHRRCGKLIVATHAGQLAALQKLRARGEANGVEGLRFIDRAEARRLEPHLECTAALASESTGIVDSHALMTALLGRAERHGASLV
ncbi:MAG: NAD(P)/FAD-dependent oxidoreductase, partial [Burkholderiaceae bacterium]